MTLERNAFLGPAIGAAQIASVRDGNPQIIDVPVVMIPHDVNLTAPLFS